MPSHFLCDGLPRAKRGSLNLVSYLYTPFLFPSHHLTSIVSVSSTASTFALWFQIRFQAYTERCLLEVPNTLAYPDLDFYTEVLSDNLSDSNDEIDLNINAPDEKLRKMNQ